MSVLDTRKPSQYLQRTGNHTLSNQRHFGNFKYFENGDRHRLSEVM